jgi:hypothetical protein
MEEQKGGSVEGELLFVVNAPADYIKQFGDPWMYGEVTPEGYLARRIVQVPVGTAVTFLRSMFFSRDKTFYYVREPKRGHEGWMAEERVWPDRARK